MAEANLQQRVEDLLAGSDEPADGDAELAACWSRQRRVHLLVAARLGGDPERVFAAVVAARSSSRREAIADGIGQRLGRSLVRRRAPFGIVRWVAAAAAVLLAALAWRWYGPDPDAAPTAKPAMATVAAIGPGLVVDRGGRRLRPPLGGALQPGDLLTCADGGAAVAFADGSRLDLDLGTRVGLDADREGGKLIRLEAGAIGATVAPQPEPMRLRSPHAQVVVVGTAFRLAEEPAGARLSVAKGRVRLGTRRGTADLPVSAGEQALATTNHPPELVQPLDESRLVARLLDGCETPDTWTQSAGELLELAASSEAPAQGAACLRVSFTLPKNARNWASHAIHTQLTAKDRALRFRLRVEHAGPGADAFIDVVESDGDDWRIAEWPIAAGGGWRTLVVPIPAPDHVPPVCERHEGTWQQERIVLVYFGLERADATVCLDDLEALSEP